MGNIIIKILAILLILIVWSVPTYWAITSSYRIWRIKNVDSKLTLRLVKKAMLGWITNPFAKIAEGIHEKAELKVTMTPREDYTFVPQGGEIITSEFLKDRKQYSLVFENNSKEDFEDLKFIIQVPYPIEDYQINNVINATETSFKPCGLEVSVHTIGQGASVRVLRKPLSRAYEFIAHELKQGRKVEILVLLNSWRDPRGKTIPKEEMAQYFIPEAGPRLTYISGHFKIRVDEEIIEKPYYAPITLHEDKTVSLELPCSPPESLSRIVAGFE